MDSASGATYVGKKVMQAYAQKRAENQRSKLSKGKFSAEDDVIKPKAEAQVLEEYQIPKNKGSSDEGCHSNRSCAEVDSDELDGELNLSENESYSKQFRAKNKKSKQQKRLRPAR